jgi:hypothetical protein
LEEQYFDAVTTVLGHTPTGLYGSRHRGKMLQTDTWINIDTGAGSGMAPMLLRLDDMQEFYVTEPEN